MFFSLAKRKGRDKPPAETIWFTCQPPETQGTAESPPGIRRTRRSVRFQRGKRRMILAEFTPAFYASLFLISTEYSETSRAISTPMNSDPVMASSAANILATSETGAISP